MEQFAKSYFVLSNTIFPELRKGLGQKQALDLTFCDEILSLVGPKTDNAVFH